MKTLIRCISSVLLIGAFSFLIFSTACKKEEEDKDQDIFMNENWLLGTWEATTPVTGDPLFDNKKIRLVFDQVVLKHVDTVPHNSNKLWYYSGTLTWDVNTAGVGRNINFSHTAYPGSYPCILWESMSMIEANLTTNHISLRVNDSTDIWPDINFDLDWGEYADYTRVPPTSLDFYGDIELTEENGDRFVAYYPPEEGKMIRFTKK